MLTHPVRATPAIEKVTEPVGVPPPDETIAEYVTG
jgi:hypothetical protein